MPVLKVPVNCGGITTTVSGAQVPAGQQVTVTAAEISSIVNNHFNGFGDNADAVAVSSNVGTGAVVVGMSPLITSITMNGNVYAVANGISAPMSAADATQLIYEGFVLVTG